MKPDMKPKGVSDAPPSAMAGDDVYFHRGKTPVPAKVLSSGQHGCCLEYQGQRFKVPHHKILGVKKRAPMRLHVVDQGEDGMIVRDDRGRHHYVGVPPEAKGDRLEVDKPIRQPGRAR